VPDFESNTTMAILEITADTTGEATRIVRTGMFVIAAFFGILVLWGTFVPISGAIIANGIVRIDTKRKTVQHLEGGVVKEILVHEGDFVKEGQPLVVIEDSGVRSLLNILSDQLSLYRAREARLLAEKRFANAVEFPKELIDSKDAKVREMVGNEQVLFAAKKKRLNEETAAIKAQIVHIKQQEVSINSQVEAASESIRYKEERVRSGELLNAKQFIQKNEFLLLKEGLAEKRESLGQLKAQLALSRQQQAELESRIVALRNEYDRSADEELKVARSAIYELHEKIGPAELTAERFRVVAPISGQVIDLKVTTVGGVVKPGDVLMDVVPQDQDLIIEARVRTSDKDNVHVGQSTDIGLTAFKGAPHVSGVVDYVSGDALEDNSSPTREPFYLTHIRVDGSQLKKMPEILLVPGMPVTAFMQTKPRTFVELLLKPIIDAANRGLRQDI
jgi:HlyD family secretion protein/epimerase transport system membrane fusion protein